MSTHHAHQPYRVIRKNRHSGDYLYSDSFRSQIKRHSVALISLVVAVASLGYNTWRNETSELHRNWRQAAFQITVEVNDLQQIVLYRRYFFGREDHPFLPLQDAETWIGGWGKATSIRDLTSLLPEPLPERGQVLFETWQKNAADLDEDGAVAREAEQAMLEALDETRRAVLNLIEQLR